ncbi:MAG: M48 family metalloprotease, partial [Alphaproteobacteria bacterium]
MWNFTKTFILLAGLTALFGWAGWAIGGQSGMVIALVIAAAMNIGSSWFSDKIVLKMYGARQIHEGKLYQMTHNLAMRAGLPMPRVFIIHSPQPNAFATGRNPQNAAVAVNTRLMDILSMSVRRKPPQSLELLRAMKELSLVFLLLLLIPTPCFASVLSVSSPDVEQGEWSIESGMVWEMYDDSQGSDRREYALELGYSPTAYWNTAIELSAEQEDGSCLVPFCDGIEYCHLRREKLWDRYYTSAPARQRHCVGQSRIVK